MLKLRFGIDRGGSQRTPAEVADLLEGKYRGKPEVAQTLIRKALRSIPLVADDPKDIQVLYEDDDIIAVSKPAFLRTTPVHRFVGKSLTNQLIGLMQQRSGGGPVMDPPLLAHRLDQTTSGTVLCTKTKEAANFVHERWHGDGCHKEYLALVQRSDLSPLRQPGDSVVVRAPIGPDRNSDDPVRRAVNHEEGQSAATRFQVLAEGTDHVLLISCVLEESGRTHQIRVHAGHIGMPLVGDEMYGGADVLRGPLAPGRVALHAWKLQVIHPRTEQPITIKAPLPQDLLDCFTKWQLDPALSE